MNIIDTYLGWFFQLFQLYRCEFCDGCFSHGDDLSEHRKVIHSDPSVPNPYTCKVCGSAFPSYAQVTTHKLSHGLNTEKLILHSAGMCIEIHSMFV